MYKSWSLLQVSREAVAVVAFQINRKPNCQTKCILLLLPRCWFCWNGTNWDLLSEMLSTCSSQDGCMGKKSVLQKQPNKVPVSENARQHRNMFEILPLQCKRTRTCTHAKVRKWSIKGWPVIFLPPAVPPSLITSLIRSVSAEIWVDKQFGATCLMECGPL